MPLNFIRQGEGEPVLLIHGLFGSMTNLGYLAQALREHYCVYSVDLRNHGDSFHHEEMNYQVMAQDIERFLEQEKLEKLHIVGHSMGGKVAMQLALNAPQTIDRLIVADIAPVSYPNGHDDVLAGLHRLEHMRPASRKDADNALAEFVVESDVRLFLLKNLVRDDSGHYRLKINLEAISSKYRHIADAPDGQPFSGPTLFVKGSTSNYIEGEHKDDILRLFPNAKVKIIEGAGHWLHAEKPNAFNRIALNFLQNSR